GNLVFIYELVETVEAIGIGVGAQRLDPEPFAELEKFPVAIVILGKALDAEGDGRDFIGGAQATQSIDLLRAGTWFDVFAIELDVVKAEVLGSLERLLGIEMTESIALHSQLEAAKRVGLFIVGRCRRWTCCNTH